MTERSSSAALVGCTGLVGSQILKALLTLPSQPEVHAIARRNLPTISSNLKSFVEADSSKWPEAFKSFAPAPSLFISALGTTRAQAGGLDAQRRIDYDLNLDLAKAAKESGVKVYVLISSAAVSTTSPFPYSKMKAELEEAVKALEFRHTVIIKPGLLVGSREESRPAEAILGGIAKGMGMISKGLLTDWWAQDADVIGKAAVSAALQCAEGKWSQGVWQIDQSEIVKLGRTEWEGQK